jgi:hypothetical protein
MRKVLLTLVLLLFAATAAGQDKIPLVFRCQADQDKDLEVKMCVAMTSALNEYDKFYEPGDDDNVTMLVDIIPLQNLEGNQVSAGVAISVIIRNGELITPPLNMSINVITTDREQLAKKDGWLSFWVNIDNYSEGFLEAADEALKEFCGERLKGGTYAWTKTLTCASIMTAHLGIGASDTQHSPSN